MTSLAYLPDLFVATAAPHSRTSTLSYHSDSTVPRSITNPQTAHATLESYARAIQATANSPHTFPPIIRANSDPHHPFVAFMPPSSPSSPAVSRALSNGPAPHALTSTRRIVTTYGYSPAEGEIGTPVTIRLDYDKSLDTKRFQFVMAFGGVGVVGTLVRVENDTKPGAWTLRALAPPSQIYGENTVVPLGIQVLEQGAVVDHVQAGGFRFWQAATRPQTPATPMALKRRRDMSTDQERRVSCTPPSARQSSPSSTSSSSQPTRTNHGPQTPTSELGDLCLVTPTPAVRPRQRTQSASSSIGTTDASSGPTSPPPHAPAFDGPLLHTSKVIRTTLLEEDQDQTTEPLGPTNKAELILEGDLDREAAGWSQEEYNGRRRLIQFGRYRDGSKVRVSFRHITPQQFVENAVVISCIYREETDECYVTSVDIIFLLEFFVGTRFGVEEKNRIRRNLEHFKPVTVAKNRGANDAFFQLIMGFPNPKPRNIEKDVKVFKWKMLAGALERIVAKYSFCFGNEKIANFSKIDRFSSPAFGQANVTVKTEEGLPAPHMIVPSSSPQTIREYGERLASTASASSTNSRHFSELNLDNMIRMDDGPSPQLTPSTQSLGPGSPFDQLVYPHSDASGSPYASPCLGLTLVETPPVNAQDAHSTPDLTYASALSDNFGGLYHAYERPPSAMSALPPLLNMTRSLSDGADTSSHYVGASVGEYVEGMNASLLRSDSMDGSGASSNTTPLSFTSELVSPVDTVFSADGLGEYIPSNDEHASNSGVECSHGHDLDTSSMAAMFAYANVSHPHLNQTGLMLSMGQQGNDTLSPFFAPFENNGMLQFDGSEVDTGFKDTQPDAASVNALALM